MPDKIPDGSGEEIPVHRVLDETDLEIATACWAMIWYCV
jgi:hypothetical protein